MTRNGLFALLLFVIPLAVSAEGKAPKEDNEPKVLSGMSVMGNNETPKSLYIVPWRDSEAGMETTLNSSLLNEGMTAVDKEVLQRQLDFYEISKAE